ncbi:HAD family phosphatase [Piscinibacter gummiphilus]|uniref:HAD family phosphatase n=1 Tax=Piscinibacter gummiphilus TaxID=946333 RepID=A0ABZ0CWH1_9BURK|nr:HAD family phosphatase [Piscinibacter gummiphilus]WOB09317.1 HAD family phosphatase [Piscinibacter gummiphilus]
MKKHVVFDFGGVVFQWRPKELLKRTLPHRAVDEAAAQQLVADFFQNYEGDWGRFDRGTIEVPELAPLIAERLGFELGEVQAVIDAVPGELEAQKETVELLHRLHENGHRLYFLSNMPEPYAVHLESTHEFFSRFTDGVFSSRVKLIKPEPEIFELATKRFGIEPSQTVFIDDVAKNVEIARAHGWHAIQFITAAQVEADLEAIG